VVSGVGKEIDRIGTYRVVDGLGSVWARSFSNQPGVRFGTEHPVVFPVHFANAKGLVVQAQVPGFVHNSVAGFANQAPKYPPTVVVGVAQSNDVAWFASSRSKEDPVSGSQAGRHV
jgi:hypothetical protein